MDIRDAEFRKIDTADSDTPRVRSNLTKRYDLLLSDSTRRYNSDVRGVCGPVSCRRLEKFTIPVKLRDMVEGGSLMDIDAIKDLEHGFEILTKFKELSKVYDADSKARIRTGATTYNTTAATAIPATASAAEEETAPIGNSSAANVSGGGEFSAVHELDDRAKLYAPRTPTSTHTTGLPDSRSSKDFFGPTVPHSSHPPS